MMSTLVSKLKGAGQPAQRLGDEPGVESPRRPVRLREPRVIQSPEDVRTRGQTQQPPDSLSQQAAHPLPAFPCETTPLTEHRLSPAARNLVDTSLQKTRLELGGDLRSGLAKEVALINFDMDIFATGARANFSKAAARGVREKGGLVDLCLIRLFYSLGAPLLSRLFLCNHLFVEQNALNFDYAGNEEMQTLFTRLASQVQANAWGSCLSRDGPKLNGKQGAACKFLFMQLDETAVQGCTEEEATEAHAAMRTEVHTDGKGQGKQRLNVNLSDSGEGSTGAFLMCEALYDHSGEEFMGIAEEVLSLEDGDVYGAGAALRCDNSCHIKHARDLSTLPFKKKIFTPMIEVPPDGMGAYVTALKEGMEYLAEYEVDAKYETDERKFGWWGRQYPEGGVLEFFYDERARGMVYSSMPKALVHEELDMSVTAQRCLALAARWRCGGSQPTGHRCHECAHAGRGGGVVLHNCTSGRAFCDVRVITAAEASLTLSEKIMERLEFDSVTSTHQFLAKHGVFITADWMKVNDSASSYSCKETTQLVREHLAAQGADLTSSGGIKWSAVHWVKR